MSAPEVVARGYLGWVLKAGRHAPSGCSREALLALRLHERWSIVPLEHCLVGGVE